MTECICPQCQQKFNAKNGRFNRALKLGFPLYCGRFCAGLARRSKVELTTEQKKAKKAAYDAEYRVKNQKMLKEKKAKYYRDNIETIAPKLAAYRKKRMPKHVEYCRQPEYKKYKQQYDRQYRAIKEFGAFAEPFLLLQDIDREIATKATKYEIYRMNGTLNKALMRRRSL